jgi:hypothetical protein
VVDCSGRGKRGRSGAAARSAQPWYDDDEEEEEQEKAEVILGRRGLRRGGGGWGGVLRRLDLDPAHGMRRQGARRPSHGEHRRRPDGGGPCCSLPPTIRNHRFSRLKMTLTCGSHMSVVEGSCRHGHNRNFS